MKTKTNTKLAFTIAAFAFFVLPAAVSLAAANFNYQPMEAVPGFAKTGDFYTYISNIYKFGIGAIGVCAMLMIIAGGYMYITSAGNNSSMEKAKGVITDAVVGLILAMAAWLILYVINPDLVKINRLGAAPQQMGAPAVGAPTTGVPQAKVRPLATGCNNYASTFEVASGGDRNLKCLLVGIANQESTCDPSAVSGHGACGIMQMLPGTAGISCDELKNNPEKSIMLAKQFLERSKSTISSLKDFSIGADYRQSGRTISYSPYAYDVGNDDLIASYNAGSGKISNTGKKGPFEVSSDCPNPKTPAWQCPINPGGFKETQDYVAKVQAYQRQCLTKL